MVFRIGLHKAMVAAVSAIVLGCQNPEDPDQGNAAEIHAPPGDQGNAAEIHAPPSDVDLLVKGNNSFAFDLYARLRSQKGNLFLSPCSISTALAMTYAGARGRTEEEMAKVLRFTLDQERLHPAFFSLNSKLTPHAGELHVANRLWGQKGYPFLESFLKLTGSRYGAKLEEVDFMGAAEKARQAINSWVEAQTKDRIKELIKRGMLDKLTRLVLTNAIYFKGDWASQFKKDETRKADFSLIDGTKVKVDMMHQRAEFLHGRHPEVQVLTLPYKGGEFSMVILLPVKKDGLSELERAFTGENLAKWLSDLRKGTVVVDLPRFKTTSEFMLADVLRNMGMHSAFGTGADFSGMTGTRELFISSIIHKAFVEVNEEGTEAAAATGVIMKSSVPPRFCVDHPFLFLIRDNRSGSILFMGRIVDPRN